MRALQTTVVALFIALLLSATPALAGEKSVGSYDANGDGQITFAEVMQRLEKAARPAFDAMDRNRDGVISDKDFDDVREGVEKLERWFEELLKPFILEDEPQQMEF